LQLKEHLNVLLSQGPLKGIYAKHWKNSLVRLKHNLKENYNILINKMVLIKSSNHISLTGKVATFFRRQKS